MQSTIFALLSFAALALAAPASNADLTPRACSYATGSYLSVCAQGNDLFCTGNTGVCSAKDGVDTFDDKATAANVVACNGLKAGEGCVQTVACC